jgi:hypothetical protein
MLYLLMRFAGRIMLVIYAAVAELADAQDSGSCARTGVKVQVLSAAP